MHIKLDQDLGDFAPHEVTTQSADAQSRGTM
jgi:hypothetical protein